VPAAGVTDLLLGIDVGTSACKATVVDGTGAELAHGHVATPWRRVATGAEVDPEALADAALGAARQAIDRAPAGRVRGIGVAGMAETGVLLDRRGAPGAPAIAWHDARGADEAARLAADLGAERFARATGLPVSPLCTAAKLRWLVDHHPPARDGRRWLNVGEWIVRRLGGGEVTELSLASRTGLLELARRSPLTEALRWTGLPDDLLAERVAAGARAGRASDALQRSAGAALTVAGHDHLVAGVGVGVVAPGDVLDSCGTAEALVRVVAPPLDADAVGHSVATGITVGWHVAEGRHALTGSLWSGLALRELLDALGADEMGRAELDAAALGTAGERPPAPLALDLHGLDRGPVHLPPGLPPDRIWQAALDAVLDEVRVILGRMEHVAGPRRRLVLTGGWARDQGVLATRRRLGAVETPDVVEACARGAALLGGVAAGLFASADELPPPPHRNPGVLEGMDRA
jgi:sugar (pentulose or hexulose) kinase